MALHLSMDRLRASVADLVGKSSLTGVSRAAGVSLGALQRFLDGGESIPRTVETIFRFVVATSIADDEDAALNFELLHQMLRHIAPDLRPGATIEVVRGLRLIYRRRAQVPDWVAHLNEALDELVVPVEDEDIGAVLDGSLDGWRREAVLGALTASEGDARVFADTAGVLHEHEDGCGGGTGPGESWRAEA